METDPAAVAQQTGSDVVLYRILGAGSDEGAVGAREAELGEAEARAGACGATGDMRGAAAEEEAASYRVLSRLLGCGAEAAEEAARPRLMVFRNMLRGEEVEDAEASKEPGAGVEAVPAEGASQPAELCNRHRKAAQPGEGLELQLGALGLRGAGCPCEETSDALLVLEAPEARRLQDEDGEAAGDGQAGAAARRSAARKGSLRIRLSRIFRTKSCAGAAERRGAGELGGSGGSLTDMSRDKELELGRKPRLTRTQSAFSPVSFSPLFTGETVSLVDVDISHRGSCSTHPPTPPPPPRRSLSLLDDIGGIQPASVLVGPMGSSLQSFPLPPPPPPHAPDPLPRVVPLRPPECAPVPLVQPLQCPILRQDPSSFAASLRELEKCGWYWGPMNWEDAEMKLKGKPDGSFLVRDSSDPRYILSLSFRSQGITHHTRMEHYRGTFSLWCHPKFEDRCQSVVEFIKRAIMHSKNGKFLYFLRSRVPGLPPTPVQLLYPVSRFSNVKSLQHLCRFRIRQLVRIDHIPELPLPKPLISYLRKFYYYDPQEEIYLCLKESRQIPKMESGTESST
ncbi:suppressor of cytokine signaling 7 [Dendropsophus ebraccatus]|uniref:suppressor of cytokine signaling 7 n=1 Tax=Dendropsophus ebraccatus TaxID=150705 RepID=UPI0038315005